MQSRSSATSDEAQSRRAAVRAFTLLELVAVLVLIGIVAGLVAPTIGLASGRDRERKQLTGLLDTLMARRVEAMRRGRPIITRIELDQGALTTRDEKGELTRRWTGWRTSMLDAEQKPINSIELRFDTLGRTWTRSVVFAAPAEAGRLWTVSFDPISGSPTLALERQTEGSP